MNLELYDTTGSPKKLGDEMNVARLMFETSTRLKLESNRWAITRYTARSMSRSGTSAPFRSRRPSR